MQEPLVSAAWASTTLGAMVCGPSRTVTVRASSKLASYLEFPDPGEFPAVVALLTKEAVRLPIGVVLDTDRPPESGSTVRIGNGTIVGEEGAWRPVRWWDPRPVVSIKSLFEHGHELMDLLDEQATSAFGLPKADAVTIAGDLARGESGIALASIGLGPGLTPAADDVVAGAIAVLALGGRLNEEVRSDVCSCARTRTTALSAALIAAAGDGQLIPQAASVLGALAAGAPSARLRTAVAGLFGIGATSGRALCVGMAGALVATQMATAAGHIGRSTIPRRR